MANLVDIVVKGSTNRSLTLRMADSSDGTPETGVDSSTLGLDVWYHREGAAKVSLTESDLSTLADAHSDGGLLHISDGEYRVDFPDAAFASGAQYVDVGWGATGMVGFGGRVRLVDLDIESAAIASDVAAIHSQTTVIESDSIVIESSVQVAESNTVVIESDTIVIESSIQVAESDIAQVYSDTTIIASDVVQVYSDTTVIASDLVLVYSDTAAVHSDTTIIASDVVQVYSDTAAIHSQTTVIESDSIVVESSVQVAESDIAQVYSDTTIIASDVVLIYSDTAAVHSDTTIIASDVVLIYSDTTAVHSDTTIIASDVVILDSSITVIQSDVALIETARSEPGQGAPGVSESVLTKIDYLYKAWRNKSTQTSTTYSLYADDTTTVDQKATVSDDGTTFTRGEVATGP